MHSKVFNLFDESHYRRQLRRKTSLRNRPIYACCISPNCEKIISGSSCGFLEVYDILESTAQVYQPTVYSTFHFESQQGTIYCLVSDASHDLVWIGGDRDVRCFKWSNFFTGAEALEKDHQPTLQLEFKGFETNGMVIEPKRNWLISACGDSKAYIYDIERVKLVAELQGHQEYLHDVVLDSMSSSLLATCSEDCTVRLWDLRTLKCVRLIDRRSEFAILELCIADGSEGKHRTSGSKRFISAALFDSDTNLLLIGDGSRNLSAYSIGSGDLIKSVALQSAPSRLRSFQQNFLLSCFDDSIVRYWNWSLEPVAEARTSSKSVFDVSVSTSESTFVTSGSSEFLDVYLQSFVPSKRLRAQ
eukprot:jgi/Galph1/459/GphlegSOOS_G5251.1